MADGWDIEFGACLQVMYRFIERKRRSIMACDDSAHSGHRFSECESLFSPCKLLLSKQGSLFKPKIPYW